MYTTCGPGKNNYFLGFIVGLKIFIIAFNLILNFTSELVNPCSTHKGGTVVFSVHEPSSTIITKINWYRIVDDVPHSLTSSKKYAITDRHRQLTIDGVTKHDIGMYQAVLTTHEGETKDEYFAIRKEGCVFLHSYLSRQTNYRKYC